MAIRVVHINDVAEGEGEYIGRGARGRDPSPLANMYSHLPKSRAAYRVETRDEAVYKFGKQLATTLSLRHPQEFLDELNRLWGIARKGDLTLVCHCAPKRCHGDVIKALIEGILANPKERAFKIVQDYLRETF